MADCRRKLKVEAGARAAPISGMAIDTERKSPTTPLTQLTTAELVGELQRLDPDGNHFVLREPIAAPRRLPWRPIQ